MRLLNIDAFVAECGEMLNLCKLLSAIQASFALFQDICSIEEGNFSVSEDRKFKVEFGNLKRG